MKRSAEKNMEQTWGICVLLSKGEAEEISLASMWMCISLTELSLSGHKIKKKNKKGLTQQYNLNTD